MIEPRIIPAPRIPRRAEVETQGHVRRATGTVRIIIISIISIFQIQIDLVRSHNRNLAWRMITDNTFAIFQIRTTLGLHLHLRFLLGLLLRLLLFGLRVILRIAAIIFIHVPLSRVGTCIAARQNRLCRFSIQTIVLLFFYVLFCRSLFFRAVRRIINIIEELLLPCRIPCQQKHHHQRCQIFRFHSFFLPILLPVISLTMPEKIRLTRQGPLNSPRLPFYPETRRLSSHKYNYLSIGAYQNRQL